MRALVVFESMFGNTEAVAAAVGQGLSSRLEVDVVDVSSAPPTLGPDVALVVVGAPTHAFGLSRPTTRVNAARQGSTRPGVQARGVREWLASVRTASPAPTAAVAFDTRILKPRVPGSAARAAQRRLRRLGLRMVAPAMSFFVVGTPGPLAEGELARARSWGERLSAALDTSLLS